MSRDPDQISWASAEGSEEAEVLAQVPESRRLRQILRDLETIVLEEGFLHLGMSDIASKLRCSNVTLYRLAPGRTELFERLVELWLARARDRGRASSEAAETWPDRVITFLGAGVAAARRTSFAFMRDLQAFPGGRKALLTHQQKRAADLERLLEAGVRAGAFNDVNPQLAADILLLSMRRFIEPEFLTKVHLDFADAMDEVYKLIEYGIMGTAAAGGTRADRKRRRTAILLDGAREAATAPLRVADRRASLASADSKPRSRRSGRSGSAKR
jgi:AcrR family transcriptional regulator